MDTLLIYTVSQKCLLPLIVNIMYKAISKSDIFRTDNIYGITCPLLGLIAANKYYLHEKHLHFILEQF